MTTQLKPSSWVLNDEPDLTTDQVWMVVGAVDQGTRIRRGVAIADTAEQAAASIERNYSWVPLVVMSEAGLDQWITASEEQPAHVVRNIFGLPGTQRFACMFDGHDPERPIFTKWVLAANEHRAEKAWRKLGQTEKPVAVFNLCHLTSMRDQSRNVRLQRGNGAMTDGREFSDRDERWFELEAQKLPGGRAELNAEVRRLVAIRERVRAMRSPACCTKDSLLPK